jgi:hypothetical protein
MRKFTPLLAIVLLAVVAYASITLTNTTTVSQGGSTVESDAAAAVMSISVDFQAAQPIMVVVFKQGTVAGVTLVPGTVTSATPITVSVNLTTGAWASTSGPSGTLSGAALTSLLTSLKGLRNTDETFAVNNAIITGTQVPW